MLKPVRTTPQADLHILEIDGWWRAHRDKAPALFEEELADAFRTISAAPGAGKRYTHPEAEVRRVLMRATRNHAITWSAKTTWAVWGAVKRKGPDLVPLTMSS